MKPAPYCTAAMLRALIDLASRERRNRPDWNSQMWWDLKSRGWMDRFGHITTRGADYVNLRARLTQGDLKCAKVRQ